MKEVLCHIRNLIYSKLFSIRLKQSFYLCNRGIGDTLIFLSRLKEYECLHKRKVNLVLPQNQIPLIEGYREYIDNVIVLPSKKIIQLIDATVDKKGSKLTYILPPGAMNMLKKGASIYDLVGITLNLRSHEYEIPKFQVSRDRIDEIRRQLEIEKREYVIIAPDAVSVDALPEEIWIKIVEECRKRNLFVLENASSHDSIKYGDRHIYLPLDEMFVIAKDAVEIYSTRSGLADLLSFTKIPMTVFYPNDYYLKIYSFKNMPFSKHIKEILITNGEEIVC